MKILGLITEYNPFHHGHMHHLIESKKVTGATHTLAIMSGHFTQRGEPALTDKWTRAAMAVACGVDLVFELPVVYACASADFFARGGIAMMHQLGCVTDFCFGTESGTLDDLERIGHMLAYPTEEYKYEISQELKKGLSFPLAQEHALHTCFRSTSEQATTGKSVFNQPNNILGMMYLKHLKKINSPIKVHTIKRIGAGYHDINTNDAISSASGIRYQLFQTGDPNLIKKNMPLKGFEILIRAFQQGRGPVSLSDFEDNALFLLKRCCLQDIAALPHVTEGLENRIMECISKSASIEEFIMCVKNKRIPYTRIQRMLAHLLLNIQKPFADEWYQHRMPPYARILAFNQRGREIINACKQTSSIPLINKPAAYKPDDPHTAQLVDADRRASRLYGSILGNDKMKSGELDVSISPIFLQ